MPRTRGPKARGYDTENKERNWASYEKPHKKPVREDKKKSPCNKTGDIFFM